MKLITRNTDYAIRALIFMANSKDETVSAETLVIKIKIPRPFLRKILQILNRKGILCSCRGKGGGFKLAQAPSQIKLVKVVEAFQGPIKLCEHIFAKKICCNTKQCPLKKKMDVIEKYVVSQLSDITLASLLK